MFFFFFFFPFQYQYHLVLAVLTATHVATCHRHHHHLSTEEGSTAEATSAEVEPVGCPAGEWLPGVATWGEGTWGAAEVEQWAVEGLQTEVTCTAAVDPTTEDNFSRLVCVFGCKRHYSSSSQTTNFWNVHLINLSLIWRVILNFHILRNSAVEEATSRIVVVLATKTGLSPKPSTRVGNKGWVQLCILLRKVIFYWVTNEIFCTLPMRNPTTDWL